MIKYSTEYLFSSTKVVIFVDKYLNLGMLFHSFYAFLVLFLGFVMVLTYLCKLKIAIYE